MGRIVAIDYGRRRCGIASTDRDKIIASPVATVPTHQLEAFITEYHISEGIERLVVGYPKKMNNTPSDAVKYIEPFLNRLKKIMPEVPVFLYDERFTSGIARRAIIEGGVKKKSRREDKGLTDRVSASLILQSYMESLSNE